MFGFRFGTPDLYRKVPSTEWAHFAHTQHTTRTSHSSQFASQISHLIFSHSHILIASPKFFSHLLGEVVSLICSSIWERLGYGFDCCFFSLRFNSVQFNTKTKIVLSCAPFNLDTWRSLLLIVVNLVIVFIICDMHMYIHNLIYELILKFAGMNCALY